MPWDHVANVDGTHFFAKRDLPDDGADKLISWSWGDGFTSYDIDYSGADAKDFVVFDHELYFIGDAPVTGYPADVFHINPNEGDVDGQSGFDLVYDIEVFSDGLVIAGSWDENGVSRLAYVDEAGALRDLVDGEDFSSMAAFRELIVEDDILYVRNPQDGDVVSVDQSWQATILQDTPLV